MNDRANNIRNIKKEAANKPFRTKRIANYSEKRKGDEKKYLELRKGFLFWKKKCEVKGCQNKSCDVHHRAGRGKNLLNVKTFMAVCRKHHLEIELNPNWAKEQGYSQSRLNKT